MTATALVGTGFIGPVHLEALRQLGRPVVGVLASSADKSRQAAQSLGIPRGYANLDELLDDPQVGVVHITSPNRCHDPQCRQALGAGKHVICEKPLAMNAHHRTPIEQQASWRIVAGMVVSIRPRRRLELHVFQGNIVCIEQRQVFIA